MDSRDSVWNSNCNSSSNSSSSSSNSNNNNNNSKSNKDRRGTRKGRRTPSDCYYTGGVGADLETSPEHHEFYATNNNDYSKYSCHQLPTASSENSHYSPSAGSGDYTPAYDAGGYSEGYGNDPRYSVNGDYPHQHQPQYQEYSDHDNSRCCGDNQGGYGNCSLPGYSDCDSYGHCNRTEYSPSPVQVTAKVLFGSVSAISNLKQKKCTKKK